MTIFEDGLQVGVEDAPRVVQINPGDNAALQVVEDGQAILKIKISDGSADFSRGKAVIDADGNVECVGQVHAAQFASENKTGITQSVQVAGKTLQFTNGILTDVS